MHLISAMATRNTAITKGYICELQPSIELHKPGSEPEPDQPKNKRSDQKSRDKN